MSPVGTDSSVAPASGPPSRPWLLGGAVAGSLAGAITAAFSSLCCAGPLTVVLLGAGGAVAAAGLRPYRLPLLLASAALLALGCWRMFRSTTGGTVACPARVGRWVRGTLVAAAILWAVAATLALVE